LQDLSAGKCRIRGYDTGKGGGALRQASAIDMSVPPDELDGSDIRLEHLADLANALVEQVSAVKEHYEHLQRALDEPVPEVAPPVATTVELGNEDGDDPDSQDVVDSARLVVMEMAMSGSSREETKVYLRETLQLDGGDPLVDEVFDRTEAAQESPPLHRRLFSRHRD
jgi:hypothetical protein